jgi:hypothetical protein
MRDARPWQYVVVVATYACCPYRRLEVRGVVETSAVGAHAEGGGQGGGDSEGDAAEITDGH